MAMRVLLSSLIILSFSVLFSKGSAQAASFTPGPTRTPGAQGNHPLDKEHHEDLREWDRARHLWYRENAKADAAAQNGLTQSDNEDNRELAGIEAEESRQVQRILQAQRRACLAKYSEDRRAWDRARHVALRKKLPFTSAPPVKPDCKNPTASQSAPPVSVPPSPSPPPPTPSTPPSLPRPTITPSVFVDAVKECDRKYQKALRDWDQLLQKSYRKGTVFSDPRPTKPDCQKVALDSLTAIPSAVARVFEW